MHIIDQGFSKSGLRSGSGPRRNSIRTRKRTRITQTSVRRVWHTHTHSRTHSQTRTHIYTHTHSHSHGRMNQCCSDYRLFCKTKHIATSDILDKPWLSFSRIMSPISPREREVSPLPHPPQYFSKGRVSSVFKGPNRSRLLNERVQNSVSKNLSLLTVWHMNMNVVLLLRVEICIVRTFVLHEIYI